jgi:DNA-binding MarR family transcriptional regulator
MPLHLLLFEQAAAMELLLVLVGHDRLKLSEIIRKVDRPQATIYRAIPKLRELGLIYDVTTDYPVKRLLALTEKGRRIAEKLADVESILREEPNSLSRVQPPITERAPETQS